MYVYNYCRVTVSYDLLRVHFIWRAIKSLMLAWWPPSLLQIQMLDALNMSYEQYITYLLICHHSSSKNSLKAPGQ